MTTPLRVRARGVCLLAGPLAALLTFLLLPDAHVAAEATTTLPPTGRATLAIMVWMAIWWLTEATEIMVTALLPVVLFPFTGALSIKAATAPYASDLIFLFGGGFILALSMQRWKLDQRIALLTLRLAGTSPRQMIAALMIATAVLSAFVSNTATVAMMLPIALSVIGLVQHRSPDDPGQSNFALSMLLGIAYAASIGGIATIIGTPPNGLLIKFIADEIAEPYQRSISFAQWMMIGVPLSVVFLPLAWIMLTFWIYPVRVKRIDGGRSMIRRMLKELGAPSRGEWITFIVFCCAATAWILRRPLSLIEYTIGDTTVRPLSGLTDAGISVLAALALFVIPVNWARRECAMNWETAKSLPWGTLVLFGGGLSLAAAVRTNGVAEYFGSLAAGLGTAPTLAIVLAVVTAMIFLTELTSNTATTATLVPVLAGAAIGMDMHPYLLIIPAALAASCAFMMPVATPPNAIVFGSGHISIPQMCRAGIWLNAAGIILITALMYLVVGRVLGM